MPDATPATGPDPEDGAGPGHRSTGNPPPEPVLQVRDLHIGFRTPTGRLQAVRGVDLDVAAGRTLAVVGESGSGKSVTASALLGEVREPGRVESGTVTFHGRDVFAMSPAERTALRGGSIAMVFQDPMNSLDPVMRVGAQLEEAVRVHRPELTRRQVRERALELMGLVGIPAPRQRFDDYPFAFSGGMRQRIMIALAMAGDPEVLVADEPTTALDVTVQAQILQLFARLNDEFGTAVVLVTHNFGVVAELCDAVAVMYAGRIVERATVPEVFARPRHPYTRALINSVPSMTSRLDRRLPVIEGAPPDPAHPAPGCAFRARCPRAVARCATEDPALESQGSEGATQDTAAACWNPVPPRPEPGEPSAAELPPRAPRPAHLPEPGAAPEARTPALAGTALTRHHRVRAGFGLFGTGEVVHAVDGVDLRLEPGETLGIVGESGCGKSSLARLLVRADTPTSGRVEAAGTDVTALHGRRLGDFRRRVQMIFQDPRASLNPRMTIGALLEEPMIVHGLEPDRAARRKRCTEVLKAVGLGPDVLDRRPGQFSGGQLQRICIARALVVDPEVLVCDEPVSALDVSLQSQVVNLLDELQAERGLSYVFISHDVSLVRYFSDRVTVMYLGTAVETGPARTVVDRPLHPYTRSLTESVPEPGTRTDDGTGGQRARRTPALTGDLPSPLNPPSGCRFHPRCPIGPSHVAGRERCVSEAPALREITPGRTAACHFAEELLAPTPDADLPHPK
ncbi:dipeptide ABC transporter ATP-binding protein [Streptomyces odontomachi]|uniref:dipeptide ABC transporter ATP-binding protein n=1 Tax=Streptomyces odontomachi TaxID=2944940 RepID=UPI00210C7EE7|nr:ABC transporter ATP-binding protein [Streptomyces sp. ODS25]